MRSAPSTGLFSRDSWFFLLLVTALAFFTYFHNYGYPAAFFWDENYYLTSAQKYENGTFFMATHPPLGELMMGLGETIVNANPVDNQFVDFDYASDLPQGFSFVGYRFFPVLFAWLAAPLIYCVFLLITRRNLYATLLSFLYVFDTAMTVHMRGAMLEGFLMFFASAVILSFLLAIEWRKNLRAVLACGAACGLAFGLLMTVKVVGLLFILLMPAMLWKLWPDWKTVAKFFAVAAVAFGVAYVGVWQTHFALGKHINQKLHTEGYYMASEEYRQILADGTQGSLMNFPTMLRDNMAYADNYHHGVPRLDLCKTNENGSPFFLWPIGARSINYRWETPNGTHYRYLYLQANPVVWWSGLAGVVIAAALLLASALSASKERLPYRFELTLFLGLYVAYMAAISRIDRVMYLYHYFLPLLLSLFLFGVCVMAVQGIGTWKLTEERRTLLLLGWAVLVFLGFQFYRPLAYYEPLTNAQFERRAVIDLWDLNCANCPRESPLVVPRDDAD